MLIANHARICRVVFVPTPMSEAEGDTAIQPPPGPDGRENVGRQQENDQFRRVGGQDARERCEIEKGDDDEG